MTKKKEKEKTRKEEGKKGEEGIFPKIAEIKRKDVL